MHEPGKSLEFRGLGEQVNHRCSSNSNGNVGFFFFLLILSERKANGDGRSELTSEVDIE